MIGSNLIIGVVVVGVTTVFLVILLLARYMGVWAWIVSWMRAGHEEKVQLCGPERHQSSTRSYLVSEKIFRVNNVSKKLRPQSCLVSKKLRPQSCLVSKKLRPQSCLVSKKLRPQSCLVSKKLRPQSCLVSKKLRPPSSLVRKKLRP